MASIINVVLPIFAIILTGYLAGRRGLLGSASSDALNGFVYFFALPVLLFKAMAQVDPAVILNGAYIATYLGGQVLTLVLGYVIARRMFRISMPEAVTHGTTSIYGNVGYMGIPLVLAAFGEQALPPVVIATIINAALNIGVLTAFIETNQHRGDRGDVFRDVSGALLKNPILIAPLLGILWAWSGMALPQPVVTFSTVLGAAAGPCALFSLGLFLVGKPLSEGRGEVASMTVLKLFIHPLITWGLAIWLLADQPQWLAICVLMAAMPTGANLFIIAQKYNVYVARTSTAILASTILSILTLSVLLARWPV